MAATTDLTKPVRRLCARCGKPEAGHEPGAVDPAVLFCFRWGPPGCFNDYRAGPAGCLAWVFTPRA